MAITTTSPRNRLFNILLSALLLLAAGSSCSVLNSRSDPAAGGAADSSPAVQQDLEETPAPDPDAAPLPLPAPTFDISSVADWGKGQLVFDIIERDFGEKVYLGIYKMDLVTGEMQQISAPGSQLLDISPDYQHVLGSQGRDLFLISLATGDLKPLAGDLLAESPQGAYWQKDSGNIAYISSAGDQTYLELIELNSGQISRLAAEDPISIYPVPEGTLILGTGSCNKFGDCSLGGLTWLNYQGETLAEREPGDLQVVPCQSAEHYIYAVRDEAGGLSFHVQPLDGRRETVFWATSSEYSQCAWSPDGDYIALSLIDRGWYSGTIEETYQQILDLKNYRISNLPDKLGPTVNPIWSPDGRYLLFNGTRFADGQYQLVIRILTTDTYEVTYLDSYLEISSPHYISINHMFWLP